MSGRIIEESENMQLERVVTVRTGRGSEYVINVDRAAIALAEMACEYANERNNGWELEAPWWKAEFDRLFSAAREPRP